jgi:hypothetical protein
MMESKVYSTNARSKEGIWAINLLTHFLSQLPPCILNINNEKAELFINDQKIIKGTIHYNINMFDIRHWVQEGCIITNFVPSDKQFADPMTKPYKDLMTLLLTLSCFHIEQ